MAYLRRLESEAAEREEELLEAHASLMAVEARASTLQNRLLSTMDQLDILQHTHFTELQRLNEEKKQMKASMDLMSKQLAEALEERQDMRDAVEMLVEKVERENDVSFLNTSVIQMQEDVEPMDEPNDYPASGLHQARSDPTHPFVSTLVTSLSNQLANEKRAHEQIKREYDQKIAILEAKVARREYEIEALLLQSSPDHGIDPELHAPYGQMTEEQKIKALEEGSSRNRLLEAEVQDLARKLGQARLAHEESKNRGSKANEVKVISNSTATRASAESSHAPPLFQEQDIPPKVKSVLEALDKHIASLGNDAAELRQERLILGHVGDIEDEDFDSLSSVFLLEEECIRLRNAATKAEHELLELRKSSTDREAHLQNIINELQQQLNKDESASNRLPGTFGAPTGVLWGEAHRYPWSTSSYVPGTSVTSAPASPQSFFHHPHQSHPLNQPSSSIETRLNSALEELEAKEAALQNLQKELEKLEHRLK
ncbi:hypothetical protein FRC03_008084 [Tulasnella sp. 419]|nr:hypothetical protein FRC03_008084 [Tulasnella sp. 419]